MTPFVIFALPRSRTAWLSRFLTYGDWICGHEELRHLRSPADVSAWFSQPNIGTIETAAAPFWRTLDQMAPGARVAVIRRPVGEVVDSFMKQGAFDRHALHALMVKFDRKLDQIEARKGAFSVSFADLEGEQPCARLFEYCLPYPHDTAHWRNLAAANIQIDLVRLFRHFQAYRPQLEKLAQIVKQQTLSSLMLRRSPNNDALTLKAEDFDSWLRDGVDLFRAHCASVGEEPEQWTRKNIPLLRKLHEIGAMQIMTARSNGRMFGYLMTLISPSLTLENTTCATNTLFFATEDFKGLGLKLQRASLAALKDRGVDHVFWEASKRGSGPKLGTLYKRLGAVEHGETYRLQLSGA